VIEPKLEDQREIASWIEAEGVRITSVSGGPDAMAALDARPFDCIIVNPEAPDFSPPALADRLGESSDIRRTPVIVYGEHAATEEYDWRRLNDVALLREIQSPERLLDQCMLMLHREMAALPEPKRHVLRDLHESDKLLAGKKALIVDDDMRNIFALTTVLEEHDMVIASAENGHAAIQILQDQRDIDIVLMDIMMPGMDGMDTMRELRKLPHLRDVPIIAVTAKAMKGDREKCIEAGAWDYLAKPVDTEQLLGVLRAWLHR
jgi:CheY-like chemotaxis protein